MMNSSNWNSSDYGGASQGAESDLHFPLDVLKKMWNDETAKDLAFKVEGRIVRCHRIVIANTSEHVRAIFNLQSEFEQSSQNEIIVEGIDFETFYSVIKYFYTNEIVIDHSSVFKILETANTLMIANLHKRCERYLEHNLNPDTCRKLVHFIENANWKKAALNEIALMYIAINPVACQIERLYRRLSWNDLRFIIDIAKYRTTEQRDCQSLIDVLLRHINSFGQSEPDSTVICEILNEAIPIFKRVLSIENAVSIYCLASQYECWQLTDISIAPLKNLQYSEDILCQLDRTTFTMIIGEIYKSKSNRVIYRRNVSTREHKVVSVKEFSYVIQLWLNKHEDQKEDCKLLLKEFRHDLSKSIESTNILDFFRLSRSCKCSEMENECLSFMKKNMSDLLDILICTSADEMDAISRCHKQRYRNGQRESMVKCFKMLKEEESFSGENTFTSLGKFMERFDQELRSNEEHLTTQNKVGSAPVIRPQPIAFNLARSNRRGQRAINFTTDQRCEQKDDLTKITRKCKNDFGTLLVKWILQKQKKPTDGVNDCITALVEEHFHYIAENLSSENVENMYTLAIQQNQQGLETLCFSYLLDTFNESLGIILGLPFTEFSRLVRDILKLYKEDVRVKVCLGKVTACWMAGISYDFTNFAKKKISIYRRQSEKYAEKNVALRRTSSRYRKYRVDETDVLKELGFLIDEMLVKMDPSDCLLSALKISSKLDGKGTYRGILELCIQNFRSIIEDDDFVNLSPEVISDMIHGRELLLDRGRERSALSELEKMDAVIIWFTNRSHTKRPLTSNKKQSFKELFSYLHMEKIPFESLLTAVECFPFLLENEVIQKNFLRQCRKQHADLHQK